jgi:hypothetical protein
LIILGADPISPSPPAQQKPEALPMPLSSESYLNTMAFANAFASAFSATSEGFIYSLPNLDVAAIQNSNGTLLFDASARASN